MKTYLKKHQGFVTITTLSALGFLPLVLFLGLAASIAIYAGSVFGMLMYKMLL